MMTLESFELNNKVFTYPEIFHNYVQFLTSSAKLKFPFFVAIKNTEFHF